MADLSFNVNYPKPQGQTLGDMINMASGMQNFQQAQQMNPLALQKAQIENQTLQQANQERLAMQKFMADPNNFQTNGEVDQDKINKAVFSLAPMTGSKYVDDLTKLAKSQTELVGARNQLTTQERGIFGATLLEKANGRVTDPEEYKKAFDEIASQYDSKHIRKIAETYKNSIDLIKDPAMLPKVAGKIALGMLSPTTTQEISGQKIQVTPSGQTVTTSNIPGQTPTATFGVAGGLQNTPQQGGGGMGEKPTLGNMQMRYPVRSASQPYTPEPTEAADQTFGQEYRNRLVEAQGSLAQGRRNVQEVMQQANQIASNITDFEKQGGLPGQIGQKIRMAVGSEQYDMLAKDLANMAISNAKTMGGLGNTVAGLDMQQVANGTIKVPPEVLTKIARRVQADQTNIDLQANGAEKFARQFGDNNMNSYKQLWNANADSKIFEAMNIIRDIDNPEKRTKELDKLFPTPAKHQEFLTKYRNIKKLSETGSL
jgi:hypothetical protein